MAPQDSCSLNTLAEGAQGPLYIRKLARRNHWGDVNEESGVRLPHAVQQIFADDGDIYSLFRVSSPLDVMKAAVGFNSKRSKLTEQLDIIAFTQDEFDLAGITVKPTPGDTNCECANNYHVDATASEISLSTLCSIAMTRKRQAFRFRERLMGEIVSQLTSCKATVPSTSCLH